MTNWYKTSPSAQRWRQLALAALLTSGATAAQAQGLDYAASNAQNLAGTYTDLGTTGTVITTANNDDANSAATPIGFTFTFNGTAYTDFVLNTNGFIKMGTTAPSAANITNFVAATDLNIIAPLGGVDLAGALNQTASPTEFRVATTGTAPNRVCTIQWENLADKTAQFATIQFQAKLYEGTSRIEFVYGSWTAGTAAPIGVGFIVGLKGSSSQTTDRLFAQKASSATAWTTTVFASESGGLIPSHFVRNTFLPDPGRTYRFNQATIVPLSDAGVSAVYSLGKLPIPFAVPHTPRAVVRNTGNQPLTNVSVTATAPAPNTYSSAKTIASLAVGAEVVVSFDPYTPSTVATQALTVTLGNDGNAANNVSTYQQSINTTTYGVAEPGVASTSSVGLTANAGASAGTGILAVRYSTNAPRTVTAVTVRLEGATSVGRTIYTVVMDATGNIIGRTPDYVIQTADLATYKTFALTVPAEVQPGNFHVGLAQAASPTGTAPYYPLGLQAELPTRTGTFFSSSLAGGTLNDAAASGLGRFMIEAVTAGPATCPTPTAISVSSSNSNSATVTFTGPSNGTGYTIIYGPTGFNPATGGTSVTATTSPFTITGLTASTTYQIYIRSSCGTTDQSTLAGPFSVTTLCTPPIITAFPYTENFDNVATGTTLPCGITVTDANGDGYTWETIAYSPASAPNSMTYFYNDDDVTIGGDDWFFTPALFLRAGSSYQLSFKYKAGIFPGFTARESMEVKYGNAATPAAQANLLWSNNNITNTTFATATAGAGATQVMPITPASNGNVFVGFHVNSTPDQLALIVDDIAINSVVTGVSDALLRAVSVYPNPSAGEFTVEVRGANAKGALQVEVTNLLGQRVHTATIRDNFENKLNLSALSNGMYTLKVKSGNEYMIRNIVVQK
ncbi:T9SS type A sorting domain-containing protein [Hymenobacter metallicola]|uniref:T9SS type A sorting domain-containing protein n=1 Tax=Hymenobacter metallicola TaxID=2563114 RepID=A0A4Z0PWB0_9BACT|nr:T9SS type A sorting domain-containing protein [Hymenobacter metallicola]TGE21173.1 T9SS type A sorting domain-containing protein [Hymenobacter metallicola]